MRKILPLLFILLALCALSMALSEELTMGVGQPNVFANAGVSNVSYSSDNESVARVDVSSGRISAQKPGTCTIIATQNGRKVYSLSLTVMKAPTTLTVKYKSVQMMLGTYAEPQTATVAADEYAGKIDVRLSTDCVSIGADGKLYARSIGVTTVYLRAYNGAFAMYEIKVRNQPTEMSINVRTVSIGIGESYTPEVTMQPNYTYSRVSWTLSEKGVVEVDDETGTITGVGNGTVTVTGRSENGLFASYTVSILPPPSELIEPEHINTVQGQSGKVLSPLPKDTFAIITCESLTPDIVKVTSDGKWTALKSGQGIIRLSAEGTDLFTYQYIDILPLPSKITISCDSTQLYVGQTTKCTVTAEPEGSSNFVTWTSSNPNCVSVSNNGTLSALALGSATITAGTPNGIKATVSVSVLKSPSSLTLNNSYLVLNEGESKKLEGVFPAGTSAPITFTSLDKRIAEVDSKTGMVTAVSRGSTLITATAGSNISATCFVNVLSDDMPSPELEVIFMDVGSNDGILLRSGDEYAFIDSGNHIYGEQAVEFMLERGVTHLKYYIGTHAHLDHIGGACVIMNAIDVDMVIIPHKMVEYAIKGCVWTEDERAAAQSATYIILNHGQVFYLGSASFKCIGPINIKNVDTKDGDENSNSLVLRCEVGDVSLLLTGDATISEFNAIISRYPDDVHVDVFKNTHHAAELSDAQIKAISPKITVFSVTSLRLPSDRYVKLLTDLGSEIYMTAERVNGVITLYTDGETIEVTPQYVDNRANWYNDITGRPK